MSPTDNVFPPSAREAARKQCSLHTPMRNLEVVRLALTELDLRDKEREEKDRRIAELEAANRVLGRENARLTATVSSNKAVTRDFIDGTVRGRWHDSHVLDGRRDTIKRLLAENAALRKAIAERDKALEFMSMDERRLQRIDIGCNTTYRVWGGRWPQAVIGKGPTILAAIQNAMKGCGE